MKGKRFRKARVWLVAGVLLAAAAGVTSCMFYPGISGLKKGPPSRTAFMRYRERQAEESGRSLTIDYRWVPLSAISPYLIQAVVITEDDKFWSHHGFDFEAIKEALQRDIREKQARFGGSTITQQLAKNLYLSPSRDPIRKLREFVIAWRLERTLTKSRILELYLNVVEWGDGVFGAEAAARHYFGKPASELTPEEAARLAVILPSPRRYDPQGGMPYVEERTREVLGIMEKRGLAGRDKGEK